MAEFILKDWYGKEKSFDHETIYVRDAEGNLLPFTHGTGASPDIRYVTFMSYDGLIEYGKKAVAVGDDCADPIARGIFDTPKEENTDQWEYLGFSGWSDEVGGVADEDALIAVTEDRTLYAAFDKSAIVSSGDCSETVSWRLNDRGTLTVSGEGDMGDSSVQPWGEYKGDIVCAVIEEGITNLRQNAFYGCTALKSITIPNSVTGIGKNALQSCTSLESITIPDGVTNIGNYAFNDCTALKNVTIPNSVKSIGNSAFERCSALESITIPNSVTSIGTTAFKECTSLESITIPNGVTSIEASTFNRCYGLKSVTIPNSVKVINSYAFYLCSALISATFKDTSGWYVTSTKNGTSGTSVNLANTATAATYLSNTYSTYYWYDQT